MFAVPTICQHILTLQKSRSRRAAKRAKRAKQWQERGKNTMRKPSSLSTELAAAVKGIFRRPK